MKPLSALSNSSADLSFRIALQFTSDDQIASDDEKQPHDENHVIVAAHTVCHT